jgi:hypothetical protein
MTKRPVLWMRLAEYMRSLAAGARGNVVSISLKRAKRALEAESKAEEAALKAALDALASLGLLEAAGGGKRQRYVLRRGTPLWAALEEGHVELVAAVASRCAKPPRRRLRR